MFKSAYDRTFLSNDVNGALLCQIKHNSKGATVHKGNKINLRRTKRIIFSALSKIIVWRK